MQPTVLIVDDDRAHLLALSKLLLANGYKAVTTDDGEEALVLFEEHAPDVVLLDAVMPGLDGLEVCTRLRALPDGETVPIVILTSLEDEASIDRFFAGGATDYIIKPLRLKLLLHRVRVLARMRVAERERTEQARLFDRFFRSHPLPSVIVTLPEGVIVEVNDCFLQRGRISRDAVIGKRTDELPATTDLVGRAQALAAVLKGETPYSYETRLNLPDGHRDVLVMHERFDVGSQPHAMVFIVDITRRKQAENEVLEGKRRLEELTAGIPGVVYQFRRLPDGREFFDFVNVGTETVFGVSPEEIYADPDLVWSFIHPDDVPAMQVSAAKSWGELRPWRHECRIVARNGAVRWVRIQSHPRVEDDGTIIWNGILIDDTERKSIELDLAEATRLFQEVTASMPGVVYRHRQLRDGSQSFDYISDGTEPLFGVKPEVARRDAGALWSNILPEDQARFQESVQHTFETLTPWRQQFRVLLPSGEPRWISGQSVPFKPDDDTLLCTGVLTDITDQKRLEAALHEKERRFTRFFQSIPIPAIIFDFTDQTIVDANEAWQTTIGFSLDEAVGRTTAELGMYVEAGQRDEVWRIVYEGRTPHAYECRFRTKAGEVRIGEVLADHFEADGRHYVISLIRDVTETRRAERDLRESREKFEKFFRTTALACAIHSFTTEKILEVNDAMEKLVGHPREEIIGRTTLELNFFVNSEDRAALWTKFRSEDGRVAGEYQFRTRSGEIRLGAMTGNRFEVDGEQYLFTIVQDVTEARREERELREKEEKFIKFFHATSHACSIQSFKTEQLVEVNDAMLRLTGYTREEMLGRTSAESDFYVNPADRDAVWAACREGRLPYYAEIDFRIKSGEIRTGDVVVGTFDAGGETYLFSIIQDVTERKRMAAALRENEARFTKFFESTPLPVIIVNLDTRELVAANRAFFTASGYCPEEVIGRTSRAVDLFTDKAVYDLVWRRMLDRETPFSYETEFQISSGETRLCSVVVETFEFDGRRYGLSVVRDITEQRGLEAERVRIARLDGLNLLAGGVAHDFNNLLAAVLGNIELLRSQFGFESDVLTSRLNAIERAGKRAKSLAAQLLMLARDIEPLAETVGLPSVIVEAMQFIVRDTSARIEFSFPEESLPLVLADPTQIEQVFQNLAVNACDAMPKGGEIRVIGAVVTVTEGGVIPLTPGRYARITVSDTGNGIAPEVLNQIFDPYFTTKKNGSGLGLALVHSIMTKHRGHVRVLSEVGVGTTFELYFPCLPDASSSR
jgi:PAS domain S-box-containing protein